MILACTAGMHDSKPAAGGGRALKLGSKAKDVDNFVEQLKTEGQGNCNCLYKSCIHHMQLLLLNTADNSRCSVLFSLTLVIYWLLSF